MGLKSLSIVFRTKSIIEGKENGKKTYHPSVPNAIGSKISCIPNPEQNLHGANSDESSTKTRNRSGVGSVSGSIGPSSMEFQDPYPDQVLENVLEKVLQFLSSRRDQNVASLVCKSWWNVEALTRSDLYIRNCYSVSPRRATNRFSRVRSVSIKGRPRFADFNLMPIDWGAHFALWVTAMASTYPWLEKVYLKRMPVTDDDLAFLAESFPSFKELVIICCDGFSTSGLALIASNCRYSHFPLFLISIQHTTTRIH